jgi:hypothetical protein
VLANLVINNAAECTDTQFVVLWVLIGLFCLFNFALCFTDSIVYPAFPTEDKNGDKVPDNTTYTVILLPGWILPIRLIRRYKAMLAKRKERKEAGLTRYPFSWNNQTGHRTSARGCSRVLCRVSCRGNVPVCYGMSIVSQIQPDPILCMHVCNCYTAGWRFACNRRPIASPKPPLGMAYFMHRVYKYGSWCSVVKLSHLRAAVGRRTPKGGRKAGPW